MPVGPARPKMKQAAHGFERFQGSNRWHMPCSLIRGGGASVNTMSRVAMLGAAAVLAWMVPTDGGPDRVWEPTEG